MQNNKSYILQTFFKAVLELKEHPEAKDCVEFVDDFLDHISNENILRGCSISWDDTNKGILLLWDDTLPKYVFKAELLVSKDYANYHYDIRDIDGNYLDSSGGDTEPYLHERIGGENKVQCPEYFWKYIVQQMEMMYQNENPLIKRFF